MNRILVAGGLGFIGTNLCRHLLANNQEIELTIIDDQSGTKTDWSDLESRANVIVDDFRSLTPGSQSYDQVWHLASPVGSLGILDKTGRIAGDIVDLAGHAHDVAAASRAPLMYVSSSEVYGRDGKHGEDADLIVPARYGARMEYALGKLTAEHVLHNRAADSGVPLFTVRPFNCAGPLQSSSMGFVVPTFVAAALANENIPVHGDGSQRRAFCHVADMVNALCAVMEHGKPGLVYNAGQTSRPVTILELAQFVKERLGSSSDIVHIDPKTTYGPHWIEAFDKIPATELIEGHTGWAARRDLSEIVDDVAAMIRSGNSVRAAVVS